MDDGLVQNLHAMLANALRRTRPDPFRTPVTVAEIYQDLIPYRSVRAPLGFQMNADYEHTLLRMLAGEASLAKLEPETARDELRAELEAPNPNVGLFRKFAACDVWIEPSDIEIREPIPDALPAPSLQPVAPPPPPLQAKSRTAVGHEPLPALDESGPQPVAPPPPSPQVDLPAVVGHEPLPALDEPGPQPDAPVPELELELTPSQPEPLEAQWEEPDPADDAWDDAVTELLLDEEIEVQEVVLEGAEAIPDTAEESVPPAAGDTSDQRVAVMFESHPSQPASATEPLPAAGACAFCRNSLPGGRVVRFCPHCGADQSMKPCTSCNEALEPGWGFCIACGTKQS